MFFRKKRFKPNPKIIEKQKQNSIMKQQLLFFALCSDTDKDLILGKTELNISDFDRLSYLINQLGLHDFEIDFEMQHKELLDELGNQILNAVETDTVDINEERILCRKWIQEFVDQLPNGKIRKYVTAIFEI